MPNDTIVSTPSEIAAAPPSIGCSVQVSARTGGGDPQVIIRPGGVLQVYLDRHETDFCLFFAGIDDVRRFAAAAEAAVERHAAFANKAVAAQQVSV